MLFINCCHAAGVDHLAAAHPGAGADVDHVFGAADGLLVVLHHHDGVALALELLQGLEQQAVVARVQADGRLVEDVADPAQVGAELGGQPDPLRLTAGEGRGGAIQGQVAEADLFQELQARDDLADQIAGRWPVRGR